MMPAHTSLSASQLQALSSAAKWYARLESGQATDQDREAWAQWHADDPAHQQAWQRVEAVREQLASVPGNLAAPTLQGVDRSRRQVLRGLLVLASAGSLGWMGLRSETRAQLFADERTAVGERRTLVLADGSTLILNTDTRVNVHFDATQRTLELLGGEVLVSTAADPGHRPFCVQTRHGRAQALGTRFIVRCDPDMTHVAVLDKAVQVSLPDGITRQRLEAGQRLDYNARSLGSVCANDVSVGAWQQGSIIAIDRPLRDLLVELSRYRSGVLRCDPAIAELKISGAFPIDDTDRALAALQSGFSLKVTRYTRYWVNVSV